MTVFSALCSHSVCSFICTCSLDQRHKCTNSEQRRLAHPPVEVKEKVTLCVLSLKCYECLLCSVLQEEMDLRSFMSFHWLLLTVDQ